MAFTNPDGDTPLHLASPQGGLSAVKEILKELRELHLGGSGPIQVEELVNEYGETPLHLAARQRDLSAVKEILKWLPKGGGFQEEFCWSNDFRETVLLNEAPEDEEEEKRKQVEELVREYNGSCVSAVPKDCLKTIMLWTGFSSFVSTSFPIAMRGGEKPNWPPVQVVRVVLMFLAVAFYGSLLGLLMKRNFPKLSFYSGYVSLFSLLFALGMIAYFTVMWVFERN